MQPLYLLRLFSGLALRLRLSEAFLLSSAGLVVAVSLLLYTTAEGVGERLAWKPAADTNVTAPISKQNTEPTALLTLPTSRGLATPLRFSPTDKLLYRGFATAQVAHGFLDPNRVMLTPLPTPLDDAKATMQRSWETIKSAFR